MPTPGGNPIWKTSGPACRMLGVGYQTLYRLADQGRITTLQLPGVKGLRYRVADLERLVREGSTPGRGDDDLVAVARDDTGKEAL